MNVLNADIKVIKKNNLSHSDDENPKNLSTVSTITESSTNNDINTSPLILVRLNLFTIVIFYRVSM